MTTVKDFLEDILDHKRAEVARAKASTGSKGITARAVAARMNAPRFALSHAIKTCVQRFPIIAEFKRSSPSKGELQVNADVSAIARAYEKNGACAISVLTDDEFFRGSLADLETVKAAVSAPVLRKDFVVDEFQVFESAAAGADALLLIAAALSDDQLRSLLNLAENDLQMDALVEVHSVEEMKRAVDSGAKLIGVNNRNLRTFEVALSTSEDCAAYAQRDAVLISESGLREATDLERLKSFGYNGFLIGEALMTAANPGEALRALFRGQS